MTFEGIQIQGGAKIMEKLTVSRSFKFNVIIKIVTIVVFLFFQSLTFQKISRIITAVDCQPMFDGGVLINVLGRLQVSKYCQGKIPFEK